MADIAGCDAGSPGKCDSADHSVPNFDRASGSSEAGDQGSGSSRGNGVEIQYPAGEVFREQRLERRGQSPLSRAGVHESQPESDLEDGNGSGPDGLRRLLIQPCNDVGIGLARHQRRQDVGIENDHSSRSGRRTRQLRNSSIGASSPSPRNRFAMRVPRAVGGGHRLRDSSTEDVAYLGLHAAPVHHGPALKTALHIVLEVAHHELSHERIPAIPG